MSQACYNTCQGLHNEMSRSSNNYWRAAVWLGVGGADGCPWNRIPHPQPVPCALLWPILRGGAVDGCRTF